MPERTKVNQATESRPAPWVKTVACVGGVSLERGVPTEEIHDYIKDAANLVWVDVHEPGPEELSMLLEEFGFHPLAVAILSAVFGAWGMNFRVMPFADAPWGFAAVVGGTLALIALLGIATWRRGWM